MSMQRKIKRAMESQQQKESRKRTRCRNCGGSLIEKTGYGWVCKDCGWERKPKEET